MEKQRIGIAGAGGYTGFELLKLLQSISDIEVIWITSETYRGRSVRSVYPSLVDYPESLTFSSLDDVIKNGQKCDFVFLALPHGVSARVVPEFLKRGERVIDLSGAYRFRDTSNVEKWYGFKLPDETIKAVYGIPEIYREDIRTAELVANAGCYPTAVIIPLYPVVKASLNLDDFILVDAKSGVSGKGHKVSPDNLYIENTETVYPYGFPKHRHTPEIEERLSEAAGKKVYVSFSPSVVPMERGILASSYFKVKSGVKQENILNVIKEFYEQSKYIVISDEFPSTRKVRNTNIVMLTARVDGRTGWGAVYSAIDNLTRGASGQAVMNFNIMRGEENV